MAEKHVAVCDHCGKEGELQPRGDGYAWSPPVGWYVVFEVPPSSGTGVVRDAQLCSARCVEYHGVALAEGLTVGR